jgi:hypothetical protein
VKLLLAVSLAVVAVGAAAAFSWPSAPRASSPVIFSTVPAAKLALAGIALTEPGGPTPSAAAGDAAAAAASKDAGASVLEYHYAHCVDSQSANPHIDEDCWAVSLDPTGLRSSGPPGSPAQKATYNLVLIDPANDKFIEGANGG